MNTTGEHESSAFCLSARPILSWRNPRTFPHIIANIPLIAPPFCEGTIRDPQPWHIRRRLPHLVHQKHPTHSMPFSRVRNPFHNRSPAFFSSPVTYNITLTYASPAFCSPPKENKYIYIYNAPATIDYHVIIELLVFQIPTLKLVVSLSFGLFLFFSYSCRS